MCMGAKLGSVQYVRMVARALQLDQADTSPNLLMTHSLSLYAYMLICPYKLHEFCFELPCVLLVAIAKKKKVPFLPTFSHIKYM